MTDEKKALLAELEKIRAELPHVLSPKATLDQLNTQAAILLHLCARVGATHRVKDPDLFAAFEATATTLENTTVQACLDVARARFGDVTDAQSTALRKVVRRMLSPAPNTEN
jgi:hypothetical protein